MLYRLRGRDLWRPVSFAALAKCYYQGAVAQKVLLGSDFLPRLLDAGNCCCKISRGQIWREAAVKKLRNMSCFLPSYGKFGKRIQLLPLNLREFVGIYLRKSWRYGR
jgi:hypothetical protein